MIMKKLLILTSIVLLVIPTSCNKGKLIGEYYLTDEMKLQIPFNGFEKISFTDNIGGKITLASGHRSRTITKVMECLNCKNYYYFETAQICFSNDFYRINLSMEASTTNKFFISLAFGETGFSYVFSNNLPLSKENLIKQEVFYDSITINNNIYYDVFGNPLHHTGIIPVTPYPVFCYYSIEYGVLKIDFSDSTNWQIESIEW